VKRDAGTGEPAHTSITGGGNSVWFTWTAPSSGGVVITVNSVFTDPILAVYNRDGPTNLTRLASNTSPYKYAAWFSTPWPNDLSNCLDNNPSAALPRPTSPFSCS